MHRGISRERLLRAVRNPVQAGHFVRRKASNVARMALLSRFPVGVNVFERDWDLLVLLDTCRPDALEAVADEYDFLQSPVERLTSVGSSSPEWIAQTFTTDHRAEIEATGYITSNAWSERVLADGRRPEELAPDVPYAPTAWNTTTAEPLARFENVWKTTSSDYDIVDFPHADPTTMSDVAIAAGRSERPFDRLIVHYMQPHRPYLATAIERSDTELREYELEPFEYLREGGDYDTVWDAYLDHLRWGLDAVERLLENYDAGRAILSADHGESFGEWGHYGHQSGLLNPSLRTVPWVDVPASDEGTREPDIDHEETGAAAEEQLDALGYSV